jgi:hypothetical protein
MLLRGSPIAPITTTMLGALASAASAELGLRLFHQQDANLMVLVWQVGSVVMLAFVAGPLAEDSFAGGISLPNDNAVKSRGSTW